MGEYMGSQGRPHPLIMAVKLVALVVLIFSVKADANAETRSSLERDGWDLSTGCNNSEPFFIKNRSTKTKKPYLTVDLATNAVNGGKKTGEENQQWMWSQCYSAIHLVNVATGGCLTREGKGGLVSTDECRDNSFWELWDGTLMRWGQRNVDSDYGWFSESFFEFARLVKRKSALRIVNPDEVKYIKGTETPWDWFLWDTENV